MTDALKGFIRLLPSASSTLPLVQTRFIKPEWIDDGHADEKGHFFYTNEERSVQVGFWQCTPFRETIVFPYDELGIVIAGRLRLVDAQGHAETLSPGDMFFIPRGSSTTWHVLENFQQYYMIYAPRDTQYYHF